jgi:hypothetical protein
VAAEVDLKIEKRPPKKPNGPNTKRRRLKKVELVREPLQSTRFLNLQQCC